MKDVLDKIFMNKRDKEMFNFGRSNMLRELKRNKRIEESKLLKVNVVRKLSGEVFELKESLKAVERAVKYWKDRATRFENKSLNVSERISELDISEGKKKRIISVFISGSRKWSKEKQLKEVK